MIVVGLVAGMFASGHTTPRLGIDLAGGTSITLAAVAEEGNEDAINSTNLNTAVSIIERRVNGLGVSEAEVQTQGDRNIIVNIPRGTNEEQAREQVGTTAELGFRPVLTMASAAPPAESGEEPTDEPSDGAGEEPTDEESGEPTDESGDGAGEDATEEPTDEESTDEEPTDEESGDESQSLGVPGARDGGLGTMSLASHPAQDSTDEPSDGASDEPTDEESDAAADEGGEGEEAPADPQAQLDALDCTTEAGRLEASRAAAQAQDDEPVVTCDAEGTTKYALGPVAVPGRDVSGADAVYDTQRGQGWIVQMDFSSSGADKFADITAELAMQVEPQNRFAIVLDGETVSAPSVSERLGGGSAEISGGFTQASAEDLANILQYGALPLTFEEASVSTVSPTLGDEQLRAGLIAGGIGLALVIAYMLVYYRGLALIAIASLVVSAALTYSLMALLGPMIGFALNLPAVCGAIVAIGITADSFIVYFERIRDEVREGRSLRPAVERAWPRARRTILVSDFVSFLAAAVLFVVTVGKVQGFAFTLGLTTALDVVVVFLFTKPLMTLLARRKFFSGGHPWSGLDPKRLGARPLLRARRPAPVPSDPKEA
ncbi:protein translocase subunit SecD [Streptomyces radicis]|nr:protein translocase subunit SecD [Streptomyces radicis]